MLQKQYFVHPYPVGTDKRSMAMVLPFELVKSLNINTSTMFFLLKVRSNDELQLRIIRQKGMERKDTERASAAAAEQEVYDH